MRKNKSSRTAQFMAFFRALETKRPLSSRLFSDPYAICFLDRKLRLITHLSVINRVRKYIYATIQQKIPGALSSGIARTKYIDELIEGTIKLGVQQVFILGAGFDMRSQRLVFLKNIPVIEIDHPNTSRLKQNSMVFPRKDLTSNVTFCTIDFNEQSLDQLALQQHFDFSFKTTIIWEGVTSYLIEEAVSRTFEFISKFPKGSFLIFTYIHQDILDYPEIFRGGEKLLQGLHDIDERWTFGLRPEKVDAYLEPFGFQVMEDLGADDYRNRYLPERTEEGYEFYRVVIAKKI